MRKNRATNWLPATIKTHAENKINSMISKKSMDANHTIHLMYEN